MTSTSPPTPPASAPAPASPFDALAPLRLTPDQFARVCAENREAVQELDADGHLITITPTGSETSGRNVRLEGVRELRGLSPARRLGVQPRRLAAAPGALAGAQRGRAQRLCAPLCPDLVVELASPSDQGPRGVSALRRKLAAYQASGARFGWLLLPHDPGHGGEEPRRLEQAATLEGGAEFPGPCLNLEEIWAG